MDVFLWLFARARHARPEHKACINRQLRSTCIGNYLVAKAYNSSGLAAPTEPRDKRQLEPTQDRCRWLRSSFCMDHPVELGEAIISGLLLIQQQYSPSSPPYLVRHNIYRGLYIALTGSGHFAKENRDGTILHTKAAALDRRRATSLYEIERPEAALKGCVSAMHEEFPANWPFTTQRRQTRSRTLKE